MVTKQPTFTENHLSSSGKWATIVALFFIFSLSAENRISLGGLLVHPFLFVMPIAIGITGIRIFGIPSKVLNPLLLFIFTLSIASLQNNNPLSEIFKVAASIFTFLFFAVSIRTEKDFRTVAWSFVVVAGVIGIVGFDLAQEEDATRLAGINVLEGLGNKNAQSLFTLPGLFLGIYLMIHFIEKKRLIPILILGTIIFFIIVQFFLSANRSGWVGLIIVFFTFLLYAGVSRTTFIAASFFLLSSYVAVEIFAGDIVSHKSKQTLEGYSSDNFRQVLIIASFQAGLENPVLGKGLDGLQEYLAEVVRAKQRLGISKVDPHNLLGYLFGGCGVFTLVFFLLFLISLTSKPEVVFNSFYAFTRTKKVRTLVVSFIILFVARSFFSREILYSPTFIGALGLLYGLYQIRLRDGKQAR